MTAITEARRRDHGALPALTGLRFLAAMAVVVSHFMETRVVPHSQRVLDLLDGGRPAVSLFFVLSGFVLAYNYLSLTSAGDRRRYYVARIARIYPVLLLSLAVSTIGVAYALRDPDLLSEWYALDGSHIPVKVGASLAAQLTMAIGWFPFAAINQPWNGPAWSISCEIFFYALFPLLIVRLRQSTGRRLLTIAIVGWCAQAVWIGAVRVALPRNRSGFVVSQFPLTHLFEFVLGICAALWFISPAGCKWVNSFRRPLVAVSIALISLLAMTRPVDPAYFLMTPLFAILILGLASSEGGPLGSRPLLLLGEASFSLYLLHVPFIRVLQILDVRGALGWVGMACIVAISLTVFLKFESPLRRLIRARWSVQGVLVVPPLR